MKFVDPAELVPEAAFTRHVLDYAVKMGWLSMHISDSRRSYSKGFPDCVFARPGRLVFVEMKTVKAAMGKGHGLSPEQVVWADILRTTAEWFLWTPAMWPEIEEILGDTEGKHG